MPIKALFRIGFILLAGLAALAACEADKSDSFSEKLRQSNEEAAFTGPALWRVADADTTVYLFGTVHVLHPDTQWETPIIKEAIAGSDAIYLEADTQSSKAQSKIGNAFIELGLYQDGTTLEDTLPPNAEKEVEEAADILGIQTQAIYNYKPWFASMQLSSMHLLTRDFDNDLGVEKVISEQAQRQNTPIRYLETGPYQLELLASVPEAEQVALLVQTAMQIEDEPDFLDRLVADWSIGNVDALAATISDDDVFGSGDIYNLMIRQRNTEWTAKIEALMEEEAGTYFVAVGAAHLAGEDSLQSMLGENGLTAYRENPPR